jgi:hypothetical protein
LYGAKSRRVFSRNMKFRKKQNKRGNSANKHPVGEILVHFSLEALECTTGWDKKIVGSISPISHPLPRACLRNLRGTTC